MDEIRPEALAECGDLDMDERPDVQPVTVDMIRRYVESTGELPLHSAAPFAAWLDQVWNDFNEDGDATVGDVIKGALSDWRGNV